MIMAMAAASYSRCSRGGAVQDYQSFRIFSFEVKKNSRVEKYFPCNINILLSVWGVTKSRPVGFSFFRSLLISCSIKMSCRSFSLISICWNWTILHFNFRSNFINYSVSNVECIYQNLRVVNVKKFSSFNCWLIIGYQHAEKEST